MRTEGYFAQDLCTDLGGAPRSVQRPRAKYPSVQVSHTVNKNILTGPFCCARAPNTVFFLRAKQTSLVTQVAFAWITAKNSNLFKKENVLQTRKK